MLSGKQEAAVDFSDWPDSKLREELEAMRSALNVTQTSEAEARLRQKIDAAEKELEKRDAHQA
jgi:hypothetical protein